MSCRLLIIGFLCLILVACGKADRVTQGAVLYAEHCALCHGRDMRGGGGVGVEGLSRTPADLTILSRKNGGDFPSGEVLMILDNYASGKQIGRIMRPFDHLTSENTSRIRTTLGRHRVPAPQAALLAYIEAAQWP